MTTAYLTHADCLNHVTPMGHPERVARLESIWAALEGLDLLRIEAPLGERAEGERVHPARHFDRIAGAGAGGLDADTHMSEGSFRAAMRGVGGICKAVDMVMAGEAANAFVACRPPGHHAETETPMGFCLFGNIAIAAKRLLDHHGLDRVALVDFDVHHGNGTQDLLWSEERILNCTTHQMPLYPGSGARQETGAHGYIFYVPLPPGAGGAEFRRVMAREVIPALEAFAPEFLLISAGFDAHAADPLANMTLTEDDFAWATRALCDVADAHGQGRVVSTLEGGYDLEALAASTAAHVQVLMERGE